MRTSACLTVFLRDCGCVNNIQEYMQMSVKNRALLPTQTVHRRLACVDDVISGRSTSPVGAIAVTSRVVAMVDGCCDVWC